MNLLEATQKSSVWFGFAEDSGDVADVAVLTEGPNINIGITGVLTTPAQVRLALLIGKCLRTSPRNLILNFASLSGEERGLQFLLPAIALAKQSCNVLAKIDAAGGPALFAALSCDLVFAHPTASIGYIGYWFPGIDSADVPGLTTVNFLAQQMFAALCPAVPATTWARLVGSHVTGEQAEALGIVGGLKSGLLME